MLCHRLMFCICTITEDAWIQNNAWNIFWKLCTRSLDAIRAGKHYPRQGRFGQARRRESGNQYTERWTSIYVCCSRLKTSNKIFFHTAEDQPRRSCCTKYIFIREYILVVVDSVWISLKYYIIVSNSVFYQVSSVCLPGQLIYSSMHQRWNFPEYKTAIYHGR